MLLYCKYTDTTGIKLAEDMNLPSINAYNERLQGRPQFIIRWGVGLGIGYIPRIVVNKKDAVNLAIDKYASIRAFIQGGARTAPFTEDVVCCGRTREHHQGSNFWLCWEQGQVAGAKREGADYFIKYIPIKQEYRVHVLGNRVAFVQKKFTHDHVSTAFLGASGHNTSWFKNIYEGAISQDVLDTGLKAVQAIGLDFGAAAVVVSLDDRLAYVCPIRVCAHRMLLTSSAEWRNYNVYCHY